MSKRILPTLIVLNFVNAALPEDSFDAFFEGIAKDSALGFLEEVFAAGTFRRMNTEMLMSIPRDKPEEGDQREKSVSPKQKEVLEKTQIVNERPASVEEEKKEAQAKPHRLSHPVSAAHSDHEEELSDDWDVVEGPDVVDCAWPENSALDNNKKGKK